MNTINDFKEWIKTFLLDIDKEIDVDMYSDYLYETLSDSDTDKDYLESILQSITSKEVDTYCDILFTKYNEFIEAQNSKIEEKPVDQPNHNILIDIIKKDNEAIDKFKVLKKDPLDPHLACYCIEDDFDEDELNDLDVKKADYVGSIDTVLDEMNIRQPKINKIKVAAMIPSYDIDYNDESEEDTNNSFDNVGALSNRASVAKAEAERREKMKIESQQKKEKDKRDRLDQKEKVKERKEKEKKRTIKGERRR